jgi:serine/threonine protein kinase
MRTEVRNYKHLGNGRWYEIEYEEAPLGSGASGRVHHIARVGGTATGDWVIKTLRATSSALSQRLQALIRFLADHRLQDEGLSCVPIALLQGHPSSDLAIFMRCAPGPDLETGMGVPSRPTLAKRVAAGLQIAQCVHRLHQHGMIIGDLALDNLIIDPQNWATYLIDIDGAAFTRGATLDLQATNEYKGEVCPPEFSPSVSYNQAMDAWSLAVLLHIILTDHEPMGMFGYSLTYTDPAPLPWPPPTLDTAALHHERLRILGTPISSAFLRVFNAGRTDPQARPPASDWESLLLEGQMNIYACDCSPDQPFVACGENGRKRFCARCGRSLVGV